MLSWALIGDSPLSMRQRLNEGHDRRKTAAQ